MAGVDLRDATLPIGLLRHALLDDLGPAWLKLDGRTEYERAMYPEFVALAAGAPWFLPGSAAALFKLVKVPAGTATVATGFDNASGALVGSDHVTLTPAMLPAHDHGYVDAYEEATTQSGGLLSGVLKVMTGLVAKTKERRTGATGQATPAPVPIKPPGFSAHLFVFAGRPRG